MPVQIPLDIPGLRDLTKSMKELRAETALARREVQGLGGDVTSSSHRITSGTLERITRTAGTPPANATEARTRGGRASRVYDIPSGANQRTTEARRRLEQAIETGDQDLIEDARANLRRQQIAQRRQRELLDPPHRRVRGANSRYQDAEEALQRARRRGDKSEIADAEANLERMRRARDRQEAMRDPTKRRELAIMDAIATSRIGPLGQLYPLVNKLKSAGLSRDDLQAKMADMGMSEAQIARLMPAAARLAAGVVPMVVAGAGAAVAVAGVAAAVKVADAAQNRIQSATSAYWTAGGSPAMTARMMAMGGPNAAAQAVALGEALRGGSYGAGYMRSRGIVDIGPQTIDKATNYVRVMQELRRIKSDQEAIRVARDLGMTDHLWTRDLSDHDALRRERSMKELGSQRYREAEARYRNEKEIASNTWTGLVARVGTPVMERLSRTGNRINESIDNPLMIPYHLGREFLDMSWSTRLAAKYLERRKGGAPEEETGTVKGQGDSTYRPMSDGPSYVGGGKRARSALPPGIAIQYMDDAFTYQSVNLGAFGVD